MHKSTVILSTVAVLLLLFSLSHLPQYPPNLNLQTEPSPLTSLQVTFKSISSILRTTLSRVYTTNDTIYAGDNVGSLGVWTYDAKKKKLEFQDLSRSVAAVLPPDNKVLHVEGDTAGALVLTADGKLTSYAINAQSKITGNTVVTL